MLSPLSVLYMCKDIEKKSIDLYVPFSGQIPDKTLLVHIQQASLASSFLSLGWNLWKKIYIVWVNEKTQRVKAFVSMLDYLSFIPEPHGRRRGEIHSGYLWSLHIHIACMWIWEVSLYAVSMFYYYWLIKQLIWSITSQNRVRREI